MANLSKTLHTNFYKNRSPFAEVMRKSIMVCFYAPQCVKTGGGSERGVGRNPTSGVRANGT